MLHLVALKEESLPQMRDNTYIQYMGGILGQLGANETEEPQIIIFDENAEESICEVFGDKTAKVITI